MEMIILWTHLLTCCQTTNKLVSVGLWRSQHGSFYFLYHHSLSEEDLSSLRIFIESKAFLKHCSGLMMFNNSMFNFRYEDNDELFQQLALKKENLDGAHTSVLHCSSKWHIIQHGEQFFLY